MSGSLNRVMLIGNLGRDPEVRFSQSGDKIANLSIATAESWKDKQTGERKEKTEWHRVVVFNKHLADVAEKYLKKGSKVYLEGALQTRKWTGNDGVEKYSTEVVLQNFRGELTMLDGRNDTTTQPNSSGNSGGGETAPGPDDGLDSEIPFITRW